MTTEEYAKWAHMRLGVLVRSGHEHLRELRNRAGRAIDGKTKLAPDDVATMDQAIIDHRQGLVTTS